MPLHRPPDPCKPTTEADFGHLLKFTLGNDNGIQGAGFPIKWSSSPKEFHFL